MTRNRIHLSCRIRNYIKNTDSDPGPGIKNAIKCEKNACEKNTNLMDKIIWFAHLWTKRGFLSLGSPSWIRIRIKLTIDADPGCL